LNWSTGVCAVGWRPKKGVLVSILRQKPPGLESPKKGGKRRKARKRESRGGKKLGNKNEA